MRVLKIRPWRHTSSVWNNLLYYLIEKLGILYIFLKRVAMDKGMDMDCAWSIIIKKTVQRWGKYVTTSLLQTLKFVTEYQVYTSVDLMAIFFSTHIFWKSYCYIVLVGSTDIIFMLFCSSLTTSLLEKWFRHREKEIKRTMYMFLVRRWAFKGSTSK